MIVCRVLAGRLRIVGALDVFMVGCFSWILVGRRRDGASPIHRGDLRERGPGRPAAFLVVAREFSGDFAEESRERQEKNQRRVLFDSRTVRITERSAPVSSPF